MMSLKKLMGDLGLLHKIVPMYKPSTNEKVNWAREKREKREKMPLHIRITHQPKGK